MAKELGPKGLEIVAFPCNQFGRQEPGTDAEIKKFAADKGFAQGDPGVNMMAKVDVNGADASPVWNFLKEQTNSGDVSWNFAAKFIVNKDGDVVERRDVFDGRGAPRGRSSGAMDEESRHRDEKQEVPHQYCLLVIFGNPEFCGQAPSGKLSRSSATRLRLEVTGRF